MTATAKEELFRIARSYRRHALSSAYSNYSDPDHVMRERWHLKAGILGAIGDGQDPAKVEATKLAQTADITDALGRPIYAADIVREVRLARSIIAAGGAK